MKVYQRLTLPNTPVGDPGPLPPEIDNLSEADLADLGWLDPALGFAGVGFWPVETVVPKHDAATHTPGDLGPVTLDAAAKVARAERALVALPPPRKLRRADVFDLFTPEEEARFNNRRAELRALTPAERALPANAALVGWERFLNRFDSLAEIRLDHPLTAAGVGLLRSLGVLTSDARRDRVLAGLRPA